jgi:hypothetical protein
VQRQATPFGSHELIIESFEQAERELVHEYTLQATVDFRKSVRPIYRSNLLDHRPEHVGSCVLLDIERSLVVATAAHITDSLARTALFVGGPDNNWESK